MCRALIILFFLGAVSPTWAQSDVLLSYRSSATATTQVSPSNPLPTTASIGSYTYSAGSANYTGYASPTDFFSIKGSATRTIKIINIRLSGYATGNNNVSIALLKRSTATTGGTPSSLTAVPLDSAYPAATAALVTYAAAPTTGTLVGALCACQVELPAVNGVGGFILEWQFARNGGAPVILRGESEMAVLNGYGESFPAGTKLNITVTWVEQ